MEKFTTEQRTKIVEFYFEFKRSIFLTQRAYRRHFNVPKAPSDFTIRRLIQRFQQYNFVSDLPRSGRPHSPHDAVWSAVNNAFDGGEYEQRCGKFGVDKNASWNAYSRIMVLVESIL